MTDDARIQCSPERHFCFFTLFVIRYNYDLLLRSLDYIDICPRSRIYSLYLFLSLSPYHVFFFTSHFLTLFLFFVLPVINRHYTANDEIRSTAKVEKERQKDVHPTRHRRCVCKETNLRAPNHSLCISVQEKILYSKISLVFLESARRVLKSYLKSSLREISDFTFAIVAVLDDTRTAGKRAPQYVKCELFCTHSIIVSPATES